MLFIGYKNNYVKTIEKCLSQFKEPDKLILDKNIEVYEDDEYERKYKNIIKRVDKHDYDRIVIDITNVYLLRYKHRTKELIDHFTSQGRKVLLLVNRYPHEFVKIIGSEYEDMIINRKYVIYNGSDYLTTNRIRQILY